VAERHYRHKLKFGVSRNSLVLGESFGARKVRRLSKVSFPFFDAVIVPSARGADSVLRAAVSARNAGAYLVVLPSRRTTVSSTIDMLADHGWPEGSYLVASLDTEALFRLSLNSMGEQFAAAGFSDVALKRNVGLMLARTMGWKSILFIDDDVQAMNWSQLRKTAGLLRGIDRGGCSRRAVGWAFSDFPDFSVVGHALRFGRDVEAALAGGGALAVDCDSVLPFFPSVYNEDHLFLLALLLTDPYSVGLAGSLNQDEYDPFGDTRRGVYQEFGDVLSYGLYQLFFEEISMDVAGLPDYWAAVLAYRRVLMGHSTARLLQLGVENGVECLRMAEEQHCDDWPNLLAGYFLSWIDDLRSWAGMLDALPQVGNVRQAAEMLGLSLSGKVCEL